MSNLLRSLFFAVITIFSATVNTATAYTPTPEIVKAQEQFRDHGFGIFIHWGVYSMLGQGEWVLNRDDVSLDEYDHLPAGFYPSRFDAEQWVKAIKDSGAGYITFTSRHHDGFSMFDTKYSDYNIVDATPFGRDVLKELAEACDRHGIKLHLYYSQLDWRRDDYVPLGRTGRDSRRKLDGNWDNYLAFMDNQLTELLTNYGPIGAIWYDGMWDRDEEEGGMEPELWNLNHQYALIHRLQPSCLVGSNHHSNPFEGEDIQIFERDKPGQNFAGYSEQDISSLPLETSQTMNGSWGYRISDGNYKSTDEVIRYLVETAGRNANLLLNIGPRADGSLPDEALERLAKMGEWMKVYGPTVKGTRATAVAPHEWGVVTHKDNIMYVHLLNRNEPTIYIPYKGNKLISATSFTDGRKLRHTQTDDGIILDISESPDIIDHVITLKFKNNI